MMKSQVQIMLRVEQGLLLDVQAAYPRLVGVDKDKIRIASLVKDRGLGFFTLDLPNLTAILLDGLENGRLSLQGPCSSARSKKIRVPKLFSGLWLRVFDNDGVLRSEPDVNSIAFLYQLSCIGKKVEVPCTRQRVIDTMEEYHGIERTTRSPTLQWVSDELDPDRIGHTVHFRDGMDVDLPLFPDSTPGTDWKLRRLIGNLEHVCSQFAAALGTPDVYELSNEQEDRRSKVALRHGPGAVSDAKAGSSKYSFPTWPDKLQHYFPFDAFGCFSLNHFMDRDYPSTNELPSELKSVPKTAKAPRLIAKEPTCYQWTQQLLGRFLTDKVDRIFKGDFVTIRDQSPSQRMVVAASKSGELCTIDLSSASDRLSCWLVERVFRGNKIFLELLHATRTRYTVDRISPETSYLKLRKFSTQGSALTFPIQSVIFLCCALAVLPRERTLENYRKKWRSSVRVFGDDIIIPTTRYDEMKLLLHYLGLKVNDGKSFHRGLFRESCGMDAYNGYDITPSKPKTFVSDKPTSCSAVIDYTNNLFHKGYWHAAAALESTLPKKILRSLPVVGRDVGILGRASFVGSYSDHLDKRWNDKLHRFEVKAYSTWNTSRRKPTGGYDAIFQYVTERPRPDTIWEHGIASKPKTRDGNRWVAVQDLSVTSPLVRGKCTV
jgi:hypothetical protein